MPHARLWFEPDWLYALDTLELAAIAFQEGAKVGVFAELRLREKRKWALRGVRARTCASGPSSPR